MGETFQHDDEVVGSELFDVVDENDCVIGQAPRREVHAKSLRHRAVHVFIFNDSGQLFLQFRSPFKDKHPETWDSSCSGHVGAGQTYDNTAVRELEEELNLILQYGTRLTPLFKVEACDRTGDEFVWLYSMNHNGPFLLNPREISEGSWFSKEDLEARICGSPQLFAPAFIYLWELFNRSGK
ncbi:MAG: NUDIX domain-containing protein [Verrucomicrobiota bacterium]|nr:NUDIX domain-containing protein [Verrucomicrobiota bacterium]